MFGIWDIEAKKVLTIAEIKTLNLLCDCEGNIIQLDIEPMYIPATWDEKPHIAELYRKHNVSHRYKPLWKVGCG